MWITLEAIAPYISAVFKWYDGTTAYSGWPVTIIVSIHIMLYCILRSSIPEMRLRATKELETARTLNEQAAVKIAALLATDNVELRRQERERYRREIRDAVVNVTANMLAEERLHTAFGMRYTLGRSEDKQLALSEYRRHLRDELNILLKETAT